MMIRMKRSSANASSYDKSNPFFKIISGQIPSEIIASNSSYIVIEDINPQAKYHFLIIPKSCYVDMNDFLKNGSNADKESFFDILGDLLSKYSIENYKLLTNCGRESGQEVFHLHYHVISNG